MKNLLQVLTLCTILITYQNATAQSSPQLNPEELKTILQHADTNFEQIMGKKYVSNNYYATKGLTGLKSLITPFEDNRNQFYAFAFIKEKQKRFDVLIKSYCERIKGAIPDDYIMKSSSWDDAPTYIQDYIGQHKKDMVTVYVFYKGDDYNKKQNEHYRIILETKHLHKTQKVKLTIQAGLTSKPVVIADNTTQSNKKTTSNDIFIGTYEGYVFNPTKGRDKEKKYKIVFSEDNTVSVSSWFEGLWIENVSSKIIAKETEVIKYGKMYDFDLVDSDKFKSFGFMVYYPKYRKSLKVEGVGAYLIPKGAGIVQFDMDKKEGNTAILALADQTATDNDKPKPSKSYKGTTTKWGEYIVSSMGQDNSEYILAYDKVFNFFNIKKSGDNWTVTGLNADRKFLSLKYRIDRSTNQLKLTSSSTINPHFLDQAAVKTQKTNGQYAGNQEDVFKALATSVQDIVLTKFKTYQVETDRTVFFQAGTVYVGLIQDRKRNGRAIQYTKNETQRGIWKDNKKHGYFDIENTDALKVKAYFQNDKKEGTWTVNRADGGISEIIYQNDKKISTKVIKASPKKKWNPTIQSEFKQFTFELGTPERLDRFVQEQAKKVQKLDKTLSLRSMQSIVKPIKYKIDAKLAGMNAASARLKNMLKASNEVGCTATANHIKRMQKKVNAMHDNYVSAYKAFDDQYFTKDGEKFKRLIDKGFTHINKARENYNNLVPLVNSMNDYPCTKTTIVNPTPKPKVAKEYTLGILTQANKTETILSVYSVISTSVAYKAGIRKGDKLLYIDDTYVSNWDSRMVTNWLKTTKRNKVFKIVYYDVSTSSEVTVNLNPTSNEYKVLKTEKLDNYIKDSKWGDKKYTGNLYLGMPHGKGTVTYANGDVYEGNFDMGKLSGEGIMTYKNGSVFKGNWKKDKREGKSVLTTANGVEHHGKYINDKKDGTFYVYHSDEKVIQEYYRKGKRTSSKSVTSAEAAKHIGKTSNSTNSTKPKSTYKKTTKKETEYEPAKMPVFTGQYEGNDLVLLMGRHIDDPAIQKWLNDGFEKSVVCSSRFCSYTKAGIRLEFTKSHLSQMSLFQDKDGSFTGRLPQNLQFNASVATLKNTSARWTAKMNDTYPHHYYYKKGVKVIAYLDGVTSSKIDAFKLTKKIVVNPKNEKVGVGLMVRDAGFGKYTVSTTHRGWAAKKARMYEGMEILEVDGKPAKAAGKAGIERLLKGEIGTSVTVKFCPKNQPEKAKTYRLYRGANGRAELVE